MNLRTLATGLALLALTFAAGCKHTANRSCYTAAPAVVAASPDPCCPTPACPTCPGSVPGFVPAAPAPFSR